MNADELCYLKYIYLIRRKIVCLYSMNGEVRMCFRSILTLRYCVSMLPYVCVCKRLEYWKMSKLTVGAFNKTKSNLNTPTFCFHKCKKNQLTLLYFT